MKKVQEESKEVGGLGLRVWCGSGSAVRCIIALNPYKPCGTGHVGAVEFGLTSATWDAPAGMRDSAIVRGISPRNASTGPSGSGSVLCTVDVDG